MYICKNCGLRYPVDEAVLCVRCKAPKGAGNQFCPYCGNQMPPVARICMRCGVDTTQYGMPVSTKSKVAAGLFGIFMGCFGVHNFYLGYIKKAVIQLAGFIVAMILYVGCVMASEIMGRDLIPVVLFGLLGFFSALGIEIWAWVEGIMILCGKIKYDGQGRLLSK